MMLSKTITYSDKIEDVVNDYNALLHKSDKFWEDEVVKPVRSEIKDFYLPLQGYKCCYCMNKIPSDNHRIWDVEHIVPKSSHPQFMFEPKNLAVSCVDCNNIKNDRNVLKNKNVLKYPKKSSSFLIVHPHMDEYKEHINIYLDVIYTANSDKGLFTITACGLTRFPLQSVGWEEGLGEIDGIFEACENLLEAKGTSEQGKCLYELMIKTLLLAPKVSKR